MVKTSDNIKSSSTFSHPLKIYNDTKNDYINLPTFQHKQRSNFCIIQQQGKLCIWSYVWIGLFFFICFSSFHSVHCIPLDQFDMTDSLELFRIKKFYSTTSQNENEKKYKNYYKYDDDDDIIFPKNHYTPSKFQGSISSESNQKIIWPVKFNQKANSFDDDNFNNKKIEERTRRNSAGPSLSIVNPLDVLRQRLLLEIGRRRSNSQSQQINANTQYLKTIGKRRRR